MTNLSQVSEVWANVPNYLGIYQVSTLGRVRVADRYQYFRHHSGFLLLSLRKGKVLKTHLNKHGYPCVNLTLFGHSKLCTVHRLIGLTFIPNPMNLPDINHKDGIKKNSVLNNLEWVTESENMFHAFRTGLHIPYDRKGNWNNCKAKLTNEQVLEIRGSGLSTRKLAAIYGVNSANISCIKRRLSYKHVL